MAPKSLTLFEIVDAFGGQLQGDGQISICNVATVQSAKEGDIAFVDNAKYKVYISETKASALILEPSLKDLTDKPCILTSNPKLIFAKVVAQLRPLRKPQEGIHPSAVVHPNASVGLRVTLGPNCVVEEGAEIQDDVMLGANCTVGYDSIIGAGSRFHSGVTVYSDVTLGKNCVVHSGVVVGSDGFGFANDKGTWVKLPQVGGVRIGDNVEIGANTVIDRGALDNTVIEDGVILDNLIQIAHNVKIGKHTAISANCGIAGSTTIGAYCMIGGASIFNGHITVCDGCYFIPGSQVASSVKKPGIFSSAIPAKPQEQWAKNIARFARLDELAKKVQGLSRTVKTLQEGTEESKA